MAKLDYFNKTLYKIFCQIHTSLSVNELKTKSVNELLIVATYYGVTDVIPGLLEHGADINHIDDMPNRFDRKFCGGTSLHYACRGLSRHDGNIETLKILLENGADPNIKNNDGATPFLTLIMNDEIQRAYKNIEFYDRMFLYTSTNKNEINDMHKRIDEYSINIIEAINLLLAYNADPMIRDNNGKLAKDYVQNIDIYLHLKKIYAHYCSSGVYSGGYFDILPPDLRKYYLINFVSDEMIMKM